jgi:hypothetical protein
MFLDDQLVQVLESVDYTHWNHRSVVRNKMVEILLSHLHQKCKTNEELPLIMKKAKNAWYLAISKVEKKKGKKIFEPGSFEEVIKTNKVFEDIKDRILSYIK